MRINCRIWLESDEGTFLAEGRIELLKKINETGSISKAAKLMNMSYKKAWGLIDSINSQSKNPLIIRSSGGINGGGTIVTDEGKKMILLFENLQCKCKKFLNQEMEKTILHEID